MTRLNLNHPIYFYYFFFFLYEVQLSYSSQINDADFSVFRPRMLDTYVSCETECVSDVGKSKEEDHIVISLGPSANYTLTFPIPDNGRNFSLKITPSSAVDISLFLQQSGSTELVPFDYYWRKDDGWMEVFIYGDTIDLYEGGKAVLVLFNYGDKTETLTVVFNFEGLSDGASLGVFLGLLFGILIILPLLILCIAHSKSIFQKLKKCCGKKEQWNPRQAAPDIMGTENRQTAEEDRFQEHMANLRCLREEENIIDLDMDGRQDPDIVAVEKKPELIVPIFPLTAENIKCRFPEIKFEDLECPFSQIVCSVCLDELTAGEPCRQLYCKHIFHSECIELWLQNQLLKNKACCPNCNADMM